MAQQQHEYQPQFNGLHVVVTGGTGALGVAVVKRLLDDGASVHVPWYFEGELAAFPFADAVASLERIDVQNEEDVAGFYSSLPSLWASIHTVGGFAMGPIEKTTAADFESLWRLNTLSCFLCCREAIKAMKSANRAAGESSPRGGGRIVNVAARPAISPAGGMIAYSTSKAAVASLTQSLAEEVKDSGILINAVLPSIMDTPANRAAMPGADHAQWPNTAEVAEAITYLASPRNTLTSGALLPVYGRA